MKRYEPTIVHGTYGVFAEMEKDEYGDYLRYEEVRNLIENILDDCSLWDTKPEFLIKEWGNNEKI